MIRLNEQFGRCELACELARGRTTRGTNIDLVALHRFRGKGTCGVGVNGFLTLLQMISYLRRVSSLVPRVPISTCAVRQVVGGGPGEVERKGWYYRYCIVKEEDQGTLLKQGGRGDHLRLSSKFRRREDKGHPASHFYREANNGKCTRAQGREGSLSESPAIFNEFVT